MTQDRLVELLEDHDARHRICEVVTRYVRAVDRMDSEMLKSCFHPDSMHKHGANEGPSMALCETTIPIFRELDCSHHQLGIPSIKVDGDTATGEVYFTAFHRIGANGWSPFPLAKPGDDLFIGGRYLDRYEKRQGEWKIVYRRGVHDWATFSAGDDRGFKDCPPDQLGHRDTTDAVYLFHAAGSPKGPDQ